VIDRLRGLVNRSRATTDRDEARIRREGYPGRGTVVSVVPTGRARRNRHEIDLTLDVYLGRSRTFRVSIRPWVSPADMARLQPGAAVPVAADHEEPGHVVLMLDATVVDPDHRAGAVRWWPGWSAAARQEVGPVRRTVGPVSAR
jgi:hypothetical protein